MNISDFLKLNETDKINYADAGNGVYTLDASESTTTEQVRRNSLDELIEYDASHAYSVDADIAKKYNNAGYNYNTWENLDKELIQSQSALSKLGNGLAQAIVSELGIGTVKAFSDMADLINQKIFGGDNDYQNPVSAYLENLQNQFREYAPVYVDPDVHINNGGLLDAGWWGNNIPSIMSSLTLLIPSKAAMGSVSLLGKGVKAATGTKHFTKSAVRALSGASKRLNEAKALRAAGASSEEILAAGKLNSFQKWVNASSTEAMIKNGANSVGMGIMMRGIENYQEAHQTYDEMYNKVKEKFAQKDFNYDEFIKQNEEALKENNINTKNKTEVAKFLASKAADRTFALDWQNVIFDIWQVGALHNARFGKKTTGMTASARRANLDQTRYGFGKTKAEIDAAKKAAGTSKVKEFVSNNIHRIGYAGIAEATEGIEEGINYIAQKEGIHYGNLLLEGKGDEDKGVLGSITSGYDGRLSDYLSSPELYDAAFMGVFAGAAFHIGGNAFNRLQNKIEHRNDKHEDLVKEGDNSDYIDPSLSELERVKTDIAMRSRDQRAYIESLKQINEGIDILSSTPDKKVKFGDADSRHSQEECKDAIERKMTQKMTFRALSNGTYNLLEESLHNKALQDQLIESGVFGEINTEDAKKQASEWVNRQIKTMEDAAAIYDEELIRIDNASSYINANKDAESGLPIEFMQIIAKHNIDKRLARDYHQRAMDKDDTEIQEILNKEDIQKALNDADINPTTLVDDITTALRLQRLGYLRAARKKAANENTLQGQLAVNNIDKEIRDIENSMSDMDLLIANINSFAYDENGKFNENSLDAKEFRKLIITNAKHAGHTLNMPGFSFLSTRSRTLPKDFTIEALEEREKSIANNYHLLAAENDIMFKLNHNISDKLTKIMPDLANLIIDKVTNQFTRDALGSQMIITNEEILEEASNIYSQLDSERQHAIDKAKQIIIDLNQKYPGSVKNIINSIDLETGKINTSFAEIFSDEDKTSLNEALSILDISKAKNTYLPKLIFDMIEAHDNSMSQENHDQTVANTTDTNGAVSENSTNSQNSISDNNLSEQTNSTETQQNAVTNQNSSQNNSVITRLSTPLTLQSKALNNKNVYTGKLKNGTTLLFPVYTNENGELEINEDVLQNDNYFYHPDDFSITGNYKILAYPEIQKDPEGNIVVTKKGELAMVTDPNSKTTIDSMNKEISDLLVHDANQVTKPVNTNNNTQQLEPEQMIMPDDNVQTPVISTAKSEVVDMPKSFDDIISNLNNVLPKSDDVDKLLTDLNSKKESLEDKKSIYNTAKNIKKEISNNLNDENYKAIDKYLDDVIKGLETVTEAENNALGIPPAQPQESTTGVVNQDYEKSEAAYNAVCIAIANQLSDELTKRMGGKFTAKGFIDVYKDLSNEENKKKFIADCKTKVGPIEGFDDARINELLEAAFKEQMNAKIHLINKVLAKNPSKVAGLLVEPLVKFNSSIVESNTTNNAVINAFNNTLDLIIEDYLKEYSNGESVINGKTYISLEGLLNYINANSENSDTAASIFSSVKRYIIDGAGSNKYVVIDNNELNNIFARMTNTYKEPPLNTQALDVKDVVNLLESSEDIAKFEQIIANLKPGDELEIAFDGHHYGGKDNIVDGQEIETYPSIVFKSNGTIVGVMPISSPDVSTGGYTSFKKGLKTDVYLVQNEVCSNLVSNYLNRWVAAETEADKKVDSIIVEYAFLDTKTYNTPEKQKARRIELAKEFAKTDEFSKLDKEGLIRDNATVDEVLDGLAELYKVGYKRSYNATTRLDSFRESINNWLVKVYTSHYNADMLTNGTIDKAIISKVNGNVELRVAKNSKGEYVYNKLSDAIPEGNNNKDVKIATVDRTGANIVISGNEPKPIYGFNKGATLLAIPNNNGGYSYTAAKPSVISSSKTEDVKRLIDGVNKAVENAFNAFVENPTSENRNKLYNILATIFGTDTNHTGVLYKNGLYIKPNHKLNASSQISYLTIEDNEGAVYQLGLTHFNRNTKFAGTYNSVTKRWVRNQEAYSKSWEKNQLYTENNKKAILDTIKNIITSSIINFNISQIADDNKENSNRNSIFNKVNGKLKAKLGDVDIEFTNEYNSYNDFLVKNDLFTVNTSLTDSKGKKHTTPFELYDSTNKNFNFSIDVEFVSTTKAVDTSENQVNVPIQNNQKSKSQKILDFMNNDGEHNITELLNLVAEDNVISDEQIKTLKEYGILPTSIIYDNNFNNNSNNNAQFNANTKTTVIGPKWLSMYESQNTRHEAIRKLIHEGIHQRLRKNPGYVKSITDIYNEFKDYILSDDIKSNEYVKEVVEEYNNSHTEKLSIEEYIDKVFKPYLFTNDKHAYEEFLVESMTSKTLANLLNNIETKDTSYKKSIKNIFQKIMIFLCDLLGIDIKDKSLLEKELYTLREIIDKRSNDTRSIIDIAKSKPSVSAKERMMSQDVDVRYANIDEFVYRWLANHANTHKILVESSGVKWEDVRNNKLFAKTKKDNVYTADVIAEQIHNDILSEFDNVELDEIYNIVMEISHTPNELMDMAIDIHYKDAALRENMLGEDAENPTDEQSTIGKTPAPTDDGIEYYTDEELEALDNYYNNTDFDPSYYSSITEDDYTSEMNDIKSKAIANGTFMKAPNGKPTNLTEQQWLQVRTKAFKNWFGDWEYSYINNNIINENLFRLSEINIKDVNSLIDSAIEKMSDVIDDNNRTKYINQLRFNKKILSKFLENIDSSKIKIYHAPISHLGQNPQGTSAVLLQRGYIDSRFGLESAFGVNTIVHEIIHTITTDRYENDTKFKNELDELYNYIKANIKSKNTFHGLDNSTELLAGITDPDFLNAIKNIPSIRKNKTIFDDIINIIKELFNITDNSVVYDIIDIIEKNKRLNDSSKVVDENGEPLVVYHTIDQNRFEQGLNTFEIFDTKAEGKDTMLYFTDNYLMSKSYGPVYEILENDYKNMFNHFTNEFKDLSKTTSTIFNEIKLIESMTEDEYRNSKYYVKGSTADEALRRLKKEYKNATRRELFALTGINRWRAALANVSKYIDTNKTKYSATRAFFINAKNPITYDGNYGAWNRIDIGNHDLKGYTNKEAYNKARLNKILNLMDSLYEKYKTSHTKEEVDFINNEFEGKLYFQDTAEQIINEELPALNSQFESTRSLEEKHRYDAYDAVISKNIQDWGRSVNDVKKYAKTNNLSINKTGNVYAVKTPNQVKSATDNIGEFSSFDNNIYNSSINEFNEIADKYQKTNNKKVSLGKILPTVDGYGRPTNKPQGQKGETDVETREVLDENGNVIGFVRMEFSGNPRSSGVVTLHPVLTITGKGYGTALYHYIADTYNINVEESFGEVEKSNAAKALWNKIANAISDDPDLPLRQLTPSKVDEIKNYENKLNGINLKIKYLQREFEELNHLLDDKHRKIITEKKVLKKDGWSDDTDIELLKTANATESQIEDYKNGKAVVIDVLKEIIDDYDFHSEAVKLNSDESNEYILRYNKLIDEKNKIESEYNKLKNNKALLSTNNTYNSSINEFNSKTGNEVPIMTFNDFLTKLPLDIANNIDNLAAFGTLSINCN